MKRIPFSVLFLFLFSSSLFSQSFKLSLFSPLTGYFTPLPVSEIAFISPRVSSLGFHLYNVVDDTLTQLFLNPAQINSISKPKFYLNFEPSNYLGNSYPKYSMLPLGNQMEYKMNLPFILDQNIGYYLTPTSRYFTIGFWNSILNHPTGLFVKMSNYLYNNDLKYQDIENSNNLKNSRYYYFAKIWLSLLQKENIKIGLSYDFSNKKEQYDQRNKNQSNRHNSYHFISQSHSHYNKQPFYQKHTVQLGAYIRYRQWMIKPRIGILLFHQEYSYYTNDYSFFNQIDPSDSEHVFLKSTLSTSRDYYKKDPLFGANIGLDLERRNFILFLYGFIGRNVPEEYYHSKHKENTIDRIHSQDRNQTKTVISYLDITTHKNTVWYSHFKIGLGKRYYFRNHTIVYVSLFGERSGLHETVPFSGGRYEYTATPSDTNLTQLSIDNKSDIKYTFYQLGFPIGIEMQRGKFYFRMGIDEIYYWTIYRISIANVASHYPYSNDTFFKDFSRNYYFGMGINQSNLVLNIKFGSDVTEYKLWNVAFTYNW